MYIGNVKNRRDPNLDEASHADINKTSILESRSRNYSGDDRASHKIQIY